jgi:hypothetical protein
MWTLCNELRTRDLTCLGNVRQQEELNSTIDAIFEQKPHDRLMAHCDSLYFWKRGKEMICSMKVHRKINRITGAAYIEVNIQHANININ